MSEATPQETFFVFTSGGLLMVIVSGLFGWPRLLMDINEGGEGGGGGGGGGVGVVVVEEEEVGDDLLTMTWLERGGDCRF